MDPERTIKLRHVYFTPLWLPETTQVSNEKELDDIIDIDNSDGDANRNKNTSAPQEKKMKSTNSRNKRKTNPAGSSFTDVRETTQLYPKLLSNLDPDNDIEKFIKNLDVPINSKKKQVRFSPNTMEKFKVHVVTNDELKYIAKTRADKIECLGYGTICHQCEETTLDTKSVCHNPNCIDNNGQLCGPCLHTRYGEDLVTALHESTWICPCCRGICNCSSCRFLEGKLSADHLYCIAVAFGYKSVHHLLKLQKDG